MIVEALKRFIVQKKAEEQGYERIELRFEDSEADDLPRDKAFIGRWIFSPAFPHREFPDSVFGRSYAVAIRERGELLPLAGTYFPETNSANSDQGLHEFR